MIPQLHADDAMGKAAHEVAMLAHLFDFRLLGAASPTLERDERAHNLRQALEQFHKICRAVDRLIEAAPNIARQAELADAEMLAFQAHRQEEGR